jgi:hypothetical protein
MILLVFSQSGITGSILCEDTIKSVYSFVALNETECAHRSNFVVKEGGQQSLN